MQHFTIEVAGTPVAVLSAADLATAEIFVRGRSPDARVFRDELIRRGHGVESIAIRMATRDEIDLLEDRFSDEAQERRAERADQEHYVAWLPPAAIGHGVQSS